MDKNQNFILVEDLVMDGKGREVRIEDLYYAFHDLKEDRGEGVTHFHWGLTLEELQNFSSYCPCYISPSKNRVSRRGLL